MLLLLDGYTARTLARPNRSISKFACSRDIGPVPPASAKATTPKERLTPMNRTTTPRIVSRTITLQTVDMLMQVEPFHLTSQVPDVLVSRPS